MVLLGWVRQTPHVHGTSKGDMISDLEICRTAASRADPRPTAPRPHRPAATHRHARAPGSGSEDALSLRRRSRPF